MSSFTFINTSAGMAVNFTADAADIGKNIRVQVTDVHDSTHGATAVAPLSEQNPTGATHGSFSKGAYLGAAFTSVPVVSGTNFTLRSGVTYKAKVFLEGSPIPSSAGNDYHLDKTFVPPPVATDYDVALNHDNEGFKLAISLTDAANPSDISSYSVVVTDASNMTWFHTFTGSDLVETLIKCDGFAPVGTDANQPTDGLTNGVSYEVQVVGINITSGVIDAPSFHVVPRTVPNKPTLAGVDGKEVTGADYTMTGNAYNNATSEGKCIELTITAAAAIDADSPDIAYILQVGSLYKYYTSAPDDLIITDGETGWYASEATMKAPLDSYVLNGATGNLVAAAGTETVSLINGTSYDVKAYTYNKWGLGAESAPPLTLTPSTRPDAPQGSGKVGAAAITGAGTGGGPGTQKIAVTITTEYDGGDALGSQNGNDNKYTFTLVGGGVTSTQTSVDAMAVDDGVYELTGLTNGTEYAVSVVAENANGQSASLDLGTFTPRDEPGVPDLTHFTAVPHLNDPSPADWADDVYAKGNNNGTFIADMGGGAITYQYQLSTTADFSDIKDDVSGVGLTGPEFKDLGDLGLANGADYYLRVFGVNEHNEKGTPTTYKTDAAPQLIRPSKPPSVDASGFVNTVGITQSHSALKIDLKKALTDAGGVKKDNGGYPITSYKITASNTDSDYPVSEEVELTASQVAGDDNFVFPALDHNTISQGKSSYHMFKIEIEAKNSVYTTYMAPNDATIASDSFYVTNDLRSITIDQPVTSTLGNGDTIRGQLAYSLTIPNGIQYPPLTDTVTFSLEGKQFTQSIPGGIIAKPSDFTELTSTARTENTPSDTRDMILSSTNATTPMDLGSVGTDLLLGSDYRLRVSPTSNDTYSSVTIPMTDVVQSVASTLSVKPFLEVAGNVVTISSNGSALDDSFVLSTQNSQWSIQNIQPSLTLSTTGLYGDNNPPFTQYITSGSAVGSLKTRVTLSNFNGAGNYLALTENDNGATIKLNGSITNNTLGA